MTLVTLLLVLLKPSKKLVALRDALGVLEEYRVIDQQATMLGPL